MCQQLDFFNFCLGWVSWDSLVQESFTGIGILKRLSKDLELYKIEVKIPMGYKSFLTYKSLYTV